MKLMIQSAMIFFGTLMAAAVVALGEPAKADIALAAGASATASVHQQEPTNRRSWIDSAASKQGFSLR